jgi:dTDP-4-dehydrorhamnose 3,5-epimerase
MSLLLVSPKRFEDSRGWFAETWNEQKFSALGIDLAFCQDNQSYSQFKGTLRGLHFQAPPFAQSKLVQCLRGRIFDVAVDIRRSSPTFAKWFGLELSSENGRQLFIPAGYAHAFITLEDDCMVAYKVDAPYSAAHDGGIAWNDPSIGINWPFDQQPILSAKDSALPRLEQLDVDFPYDAVPLSEPKEVTP